MRVIDHIFEDLPERTNTQWLVGRNGEVLPLASSNPITADAGSRGNLGNVDLKGGQQPRGQRRLRTFLQVELGGFAEVGEGFLDGVALARGADLRALRHVDLVFPVQDRREALGGGGRHGRRGGVASSLAGQKPTTPSPVTTPPGSPAPAATEIPPRHRAFALVAFVGGKAETRTVQWGRGPGRGSGWRGRRGLLRRAVWKSSLELVLG